MKTYLVQSNTDSQQIVIAKLNYHTYAYDTIFTGKDVTKALQTLVDTHNEVMQAEYSDFIEAKTKLENLRR